MKKIRVIQIGTSHAHALGALGTLRELDSVFELAAVAEPDASAREKLANHPAFSGLHICDVEEALSLPDLDAAVIEVAEKDLCHYAKLAAERGLHIQMDKPGGENYTEFAQMIDLLREKNLVFQPGYMYRFNPAVQKALELVHSGELGDIFSVEAQMSIDMGDHRDPLLSKFQGGMMYFLGCHLVDLLYQISGTPQQVFPFLRSLRGASSDFGMAVYTYEKGVSFLKTCGAELNGFLRRQLVITGTLGTVEIKPLELFQIEDPQYLETSLRLTLKKDHPHANFDGAKCFTFPRYRRYDAMFLHFARMIQGLAKPICSYEQELELFGLVLESSGIPLQ